MYIARVMGFTGKIEISSKDEAHSIHLLKALQYFDVVEGCNEATTEVGRFLANRTR